MIFCASVPHVDKRTIKVLMKLGQSRPTARPSGGDRAFLDKGATPP